MSQSSITSHDFSQPAPVTGTTQPGSVLPRWQLWQTVRDAAPSAAVFFILVGLAAWGHTTGWTLPKFSALVGNGIGETDDWCKEHGVPESQCIECNPSLVSSVKDYGWCKEHGIAQCPFEHPDVAQLKAVPATLTQQLERARSALAVRPRSDNNSRCLLHQRRIQFASVSAVEKAGVDIAIVTQRPIVEAVVSNGEVLYDETHAAHLASRVAGTAWRVEKQVGDHVKKGDILALVDAADVGRAKAEFLQAITQLRLTKSNAERLKPLAGGTVAARQVREAEAAFQQAQSRVLAAQQTLINFGFKVRVDDFEDLDIETISKRIQFLGLPPELIASFDQESTTSNLFPLQSPLDGVVVARNVVAGEVVDSNTMIFGVADTRQMWLMLNVRQDDVQYLKLDQTVLFQPSDRHNEPEIKGSLAWISTEADDETRTIKARVNLPNEDSRLRANTFGTGRIVLRDESQAIVVPNESVHWDGCCNIVFVRDKDYLKEDAFKFFHIRKVRLGVRNDDVTEVIAGLLPGEVLASKNSVVLEAQLLKSNLGAGCCEVHAPKSK